MTVCWSVGWSLVGLSRFLKRREVTLSCSYRGTFVLPEDEEEEAVAAAAQPDQPDHQVEHRLGQV